MIEILVKRGLGDKQGPDINDTLITSVPVALARGAAEVNKSCSDRKALSISTTLLPRISPGSLVKVITHKGIRVGKLKSFERTYTISEADFTADCELEIEVVDE